jgi:hypothetical protein
MELCGVGGGFIGSGRGDGKGMVVVVPGVQGYGAG